MPWSGRPRASSRAPAPSPNRGYVFRSFGLTTRELQSPPTIKARSLPPKTAEPARGSRAPRQPAPAASTSTAGHSRRGGAGTRGAVGGNDWGGVTAPSPSGSRARGPTIGRDTSDLQPPV